jgi:phosphoenolpyruvate carboxykinase (GTP)
MRVLKWIVERVEGKAGARSTPLGNVPESLDMQGLEGFGADKLSTATAIERDQWSKEMGLHGELIDKLTHRLPQQIKARFEELKKAFA